MFSSVSIPGQKVYFAAISPPVKDMQIFEIGPYTTTVVDKARERDDFVTMRHRVRREVLPIVSRCLTPGNFRLIDFRPAYKALELHYNNRQGKPFIWQINFARFNAPVKIIKAAIRKARANIPEDITVKSREMMLKKLNEIDPEMLANNILEATVTTSILTDKSPSRMRNAFFVSGKDAIGGTECRKAGFRIKGGPTEALDDGLYWVRLDREQTMPDPMDWYLLVKRQPSGKVTFTLNPLVWFVGYRGILDAA